MITPLITIVGSIVIAGLTYWFTKQREREAELRKEQLEHYKAFVVSLSGSDWVEGTADGQRAFALACNNLMLVAPQSVIEALRAFQQEIRVSNPNKDSERHDKLLSKLFFEIRKDLRVQPADNSETFRVGLWASGVGPKEPDNKALTD